MKIIIATPLYPPEIGEIAIYSKSLAEHLGQKHKITVVAYANNLEKNSKISFVQINKDKFVFFRYVKYFIKLFQASQNADIILVQNTVAAGLPSIIIKYLRHIPVVINFIEDEAWKNALRTKKTKSEIAEFYTNPRNSLKTNFIISIQKFVFRHADKVILPSIYLTDIISNKYSQKEKKFFVNYLPPEKQEIFPFEQENNEHQILVLDYEDTTKILDVVDAVSMLNKEYKNIRLLCANGNLSKENIKRITDDAKIDNNIFFLGHLSKAENWSFIKTSQICILNSQNDSFIKNAQKCFMLGIPIITEGTSAAREIITDKNTGLLFSPANKKEIDEAIKRLLNDTELYQKITENGKKFLLKNLSWKNHIKNLINLLENNLNTKRQN